MQIDPDNGAHSYRPQPSPDVAVNERSSADRLERDRYRQFAAELDELRGRLLRTLGPQDVRYIHRMGRISDRLELAGRMLIHFSWEPVGFALGVTALALHKQLETSEIGHAALHGTWDKLPVDRRFRSSTFRWRTPIDEESWRRVHNFAHHGHTNIAGKDPDIHFGLVRLTDQTPPRPTDWMAMPLLLGFIAPNFLFVINSHVTGMNDLVMGNGLPSRWDVLSDRRWASARVAFARALRKYVPYYLKEYGFYPLLAGPFFWKVAFGNWLAETARSLYSASCILCGHVGEDIKSWPAGTAARGRGEWYVMQIEAAQDFEAPDLLSVLCGGLDCQIEHHLFPTLPPARLRQIRGEVREICERHHVAYKAPPWPTALRKAITQVARLSRVQGLRAVLHAVV